MRPWEQEEQPQPMDPGPSEDTESSSVASLDPERDSLIPGGARSASSEGSDSQGSDAALAIN